MTQQHSPRFAPQNVTCTCNMPSKWFQWSTDVTLFIEAWHVTSPAWYLVTCVVVFVLAVVYEWLATFKQRVDLGKSHKERVEGEWISAPNFPRHLRVNLYFLLGSVLHMLQLCMAYMLMISIMVSQTFTPFLFPLK